MIKYKQLILRILTLFCIVIVISYCIYSVRVYSSSIGLFDGVDIQISGNNYIDSQRIENEIYPQISSSILSINSQVPSVKFVPSALQSFKQKVSPVSSS